MSTPAQIAANIANAQSSCGPRSAAGKAKSSKNAITLGLFSGDFIRPGEESAYAAFEIALARDLAPVGALEEILAEEIHRAVWRLHRCGEVESHLVIRLNDGENYILDAMESGNAAEKIQNSVDRARSQAHRLLHKSTAELRKLQTERHYRNQNLEAGTDLSAYGLADSQSIAASPKQPVAQRTQSQPSGTPRNAPCPCGSGQKHKRCCGQARRTASPLRANPPENAPAKLHAA
jgi:hypothetical protein